MNNDQRLAVNIRALLTGQAVTWMCSGIVVVALPRFLGSADLGRYSVAILLIALVGQLLDLGGNTYLIKTIPQSSREHAVALIVNAFVVRLPLMILGVLVGIVVAVAFIDDRSTQTLVLLLLPSMVIQAFTMLMTSALKGLQDFRPVALAESSSRVITLGLFLVLLILGYGIYSIAVAVTIASLTGFILAGASVIRQIGMPRGIRLNLWKLLLFAGWPFFLSQVAIGFHSQVDILILSKLTTEEVVGWYAAAYRIVGIPMFIPSIVIAVFFPAISEKAVSDLAEVGNTARRALRLVLLGMVPIMFGTVVLPDKIVALLGYGADFQESIPLIAVLALHLPLVGVTTLTAVASFAFDKQKSWVKILFTVTVMDAVLNVTIIPTAQSSFGNGALACALITVLSEVVVLIMGLRVLPKGILGRAALEDTVRCLAAGLIMATVVFFLRSEPILITIAIGAVIYTGAVYLLRAAGREEIELLRNMLRRRQSQPAVTVVG